jgi:Site-specific DNA methylase
MLRTIREIQPRWVVGENVLGLVNWSGGLVFEEVQADLEAEGYEVQPFILPAASVNAPHKRDRVWFVAFKNTQRNGRIQREPEQEGAEIREQRNACSGDSIGVCGEKVAGVTADTDNVRLQQCKTPGTLGEGQKEVCGEGDKPTMRAETNECFGVTTDTDNDGRIATKIGQGLGEGNDRNKTGENNAVKLEGRAFSDGITPDTESGGNGRLRNEGETTGTRESSITLGSVCGIPNWDNFPTTEPTIRTGNDGFPTELDGITFSKWRNESIKAAGNAICPQVVYQIFKSINEYENLHTNRKNP